MTKIEEHFMHVQRHISLVASYSLFLCGSAFAIDQKWAGTKQLQSFSCSIEKVDKIIISGAVKLNHPKDMDPFQSASTINIDCANLTLEQGSSLSSISSIDIRIDDTTSGPVKIVSTRGVKGADGPSSKDPKAPASDDIWAFRKMQNGPKGPDGGGGRDAKKCIEVSHGSDPGGRGTDGTPGQSGLLFKAPKGPSGKNGAPASDITFITRRFAPGSTVELSALGGQGGTGGRGGRGADGETVGREERAVRVATLAIAICRLEEATEEPVEEAEMVEMAARAGMAEMAVRAVRSIHLLKMVHRFIRRQFIT
jgi:hypothetical protein